MATRHDSGKTGGGAGPSGASSWADEYLDTTDSQPNRHAGYGDQKSYWCKDCRHQPDGNRFGDSGGRASGQGRSRSEEHTSELQSLMRISYAVFCLKKKKQKA